MKCFYHPDLEAAATCQRCGKGLCHACAAKRSPCLCDECASILQSEREEQILSEENERKQKYLNALIDTKKEFFKACIIGVIVAACCRIPDAEFASVFCFFIPFGWKLLTYLQSKSSIFLIGNIVFWIAWLFMKAMLSIFVGTPAFVYQLIKTFSAQKEIDKMK